MTCCKCFFITPQDFVGRVVISENVPNEYITPSIELAQITFIRPLLCDDLYEELCEQINSDTVTDLNYDLLCYIRDVQVRYAFADFIAKHPVKVTKESVVRKVANESEFVPFENIYNLSKQYRLDADSYANLMVKYLKDNQDSYPLWQNSACNDCGKDSNPNGGFF